MSDSVSFRVVYHGDVYANLPGVVERARIALQGVDFDTLVGTGLSGAIVIPYLATVMKKHFLLVRRFKGESSHDIGMLVGDLGERWVFVDDLVCGGETRRRVIQEVSAAWSSTQCVGQYLYRNDGRYTPYRASWTKIGGDD